MTEALYRKYRPSTFRDIVGQEHIERTLKNAIEQNKVSHAYLFCGPRGTGKTTTARILAKALLCAKGPTVDPDGTCPECLAIAAGNHPDVYELDAASRTGVENVREEIISRVQYAPTRGSVKIYIIDEVHMLSTAAFNALLKTLEEPPAHVVFILCTTDPQKVPETIHSRCQRFDFHRIATEAIVARLGAVCVEEGVEFEGEALDLIAHRAEGGMRNALTSLEQLIAFGEGRVTLEGAQNLLGSLDDTDVSEIVLAIGRRDAATCFNWVARYVETGADLAQFVRDLAEHYRDLYLLSMTDNEVEIEVSDATRTTMVGELTYYGRDRLSRILQVLGDLIKELRLSSNPRLSFEIALTRMVRPDSDFTLEALAERVEALEMRLAQGDFSVPPLAMTPSTASNVVSEPAGSASPLNVTQGSTPAPLHASQVGSSAAVSGNPAAQPVAPRPVTDASAMEVGSAVFADVSSPSPVAAPPAAQAVQASAVPSSSVDVSNPAALQRLWHSVTAALRKENPARGVLFMNARVSSDTQTSGILVEFAADNSFAYKAAQKKEVRELLARTLEKVAGGSLPFRLALAQGGASAPAESSKPVVRPGAPTSFAAPTPSVEASAPTPVPSASTTPLSSVTTPVEDADDRVPLDAYGSFPSGEEAPPTSIPSTPAPTAVAQPVPPSPSASPSAAAVQQEKAKHSGELDASDGETAQIVDVLTASFGEGIKFEEV